MRTLAMTISHVAPMLLLLLIATGCAHGRASSGPVKSFPVITSMKTDANTICPNGLSKECDERLVNTFHARLGNTYWAADFAGVRRTCDAQAMPCGFEQVEAMCADSHGANVRRLSAQEQQARMNNAAHALGAMSRTLNGPPTIQCVSQPPLVPGGPVNTVCK